MMDDLQAMDEAQPGEVILFHTKLRVELGYTGRGVNLLLRVADLPYNRKEQGQTSANKESKAIT